SDPIRRVDFRPIELSSGLWQPFPAAGASVRAQIRASSRGGIFLPRVMSSAVGGPTVVRATDAYLTWFTL
ncbi:hypothetical protein EVAR_69518_1, partial [Eumeta japonica]